MPSERLSRSIRPSRTVRSRLTLLAAALVAATLLFTAVGLVILNQGLLTRAVDESLRQRADNVEPDVARGAFGALFPEAGDREDTFAQIIDGDSRVRAASPNVAGLTAATTPLAPGAADVLRTVSAPTISSHQFRVLSRSIDSARGPHTLIVARNLDDVSESVDILMTSLMVSIPVVVLLLAAVVWWLMGRALAPMEAIRAEVSSMRGDELNRRVPVPPGDDEVSRLARTMNALLERVEQATARQRQFVGDASHELRSPLTRIRSTLEVSIAHPPTGGPDSTYDSLLSDTVQLQQLVDDLLFLARSDSGLVDGPDDVVDLDDLVLEQVRQIRARGRVFVDASAVSAARVSGDAHALSRAIANLGSNAERHAATTVTFALSERDDRCELVVGDDGPGIPVEHREAVFKRFTRLDSARSRGGGGAGLGLAIVADIVVRHHGTIHVGRSPAGGACLTVALPIVD